MLVELRLGDADGLLKVAIGKFRIKDRVAVVLQEARFDAAWGGENAVEEEDGGHEDKVYRKKFFLWHNPFAFLQLRQTD